MSRQSTERLRICHLLQVRRVNAFLSGLLFGLALCGPGRSTLDCLLPQWLPLVNWHGPLQAGRMTFSTERQGHTAAQRYCDCGGVDGLLMLIWTPLPPVLQHRGAFY